MIKKTPVVYISYCRSSAEDTAWAKQLAGRLRDDGIRALLDVWELRPGMVIDGWYSEAIRSCDVAVMIGSDALTTQWRGKIGPPDLIALQSIFFRSKCFIPVLFPRNSSQDLPEPFYNRVGVKMDPANVSIGYADLVRSLTGRDAESAPPVRKKKSVKPCSLGSCFAQAAQLFPVSPYPNVTTGSHRGDRSDGI